MYNPNPSELVRADSCAIDLAERLPIANELIYCGKTAYFARCRVVALRDTDGILLQDAQSIGTCPLHQVEG